MTDPAWRTSFFAKCSALFLVILFSLFLLLEKLLRVKREVKTKLMEGDALEKNYGLFVCCIDGKW